MQWKSALYLEIRLRYERDVRHKGLDEKVGMQFILSTLKLGLAGKSNLWAVFKDVLPEQ